MTQQVPSALAKPSTDRITQPGKPSAAGPTSDVATGPRANAPPPDLRGNAREAARRAGEAARNGASVADALAAAKAKPAEAPEPAEAAQTSQAEAAPETPAASETPVETPPAEESPLDVRTRVRQREQRMQRELEQRQTDLARREAEIQQRETQTRQILDRHAQLEQLKKTDIAKWAQEIGLDETTLKPIVMSRIAAGKPEGQVLTLEQKVATLEQRLETERQEIQRQNQAMWKQQNEQEFVKFTTDAAKYPTFAAMYGDDPREVVERGYAMERRFQQQFRRPPTREELAVNLEREAKERAQRAAKVVPAAHAAAPAPATPKPKPPSPSEQARTAPPQRSDRVETERERKERASLAAKKAIAGANKRNVGQAR